MEQRVPPSGIVTLTTDFGLLDSYVGQMKGAVLRVDPAIRVVDLCHEVPAQRVDAGAYVLETGYAAFPEGTVHVAVVDPGVGTSRRALAVQAGSHYFVAPDNGLLTRVLLREPLAEARLLENESYLGPERSATFEGRDRFAPAAAWIARGTALDRLGPEVADPVRLPGVRPSLRAGKPTPVAVLAVDRFGNVTLDAHESDLRALLGTPPGPGCGLCLETPAGEVAEFRRTFAEGSGSAPFLLLNSAGYLEVAVWVGRADAALGLAVGSRPVLTLRR